LSPPNIASSAPEKEGKGEKQEGMHLGLDANLPKMQDHELGSRQTRSQKSRADCCPKHTKVRGTGEPKRTLVIIDADTRGGELKRPSTGKEENIPGVEVAESVKRGGVA